MEKTESFVGDVPVYRYTGSGPARFAQILLPGIGGYGGYYEAYTKHQVEHGGDVWGMDPPAHGRSARRRGKFTMEEYLHDVVALAAHIRAETGLPVITTGSSLGSGPAFYAMELSDDIVGGVAMGVCIGAAGWMKKVRSLFNSADVTALMDIYGWALELNIWRTIGLEDNYGTKEMVERILKDPLVSERYDLASYKSFVCYEPRTPAIENRKPLLVAVGGEDPLFPIPQVKRVFAGIGGPTELKVFEGAPHQVMFHDPNAFATMVEDWFERQALAPAA